MLGSRWRKRADPPAEASSSGEVRLVPLPAAGTGDGVDSSGGGESNENGDGGDAASDPTTAAATPQPVPANAAVLDELSAAFAERPTISIGGDELPDAVYLDDELERGVAVGATLFIDDDGSADAVAPKEASTRGIEPRLRQRRIGVRRAESRRRLKWVIVAGLVLAVVVAALAVLGSSLFAVKNVDVSGNVYTDAAQLQAVVDDLTGTPVLRVDTLAAEEQLESIPWVEDARVTTKFPDSATIEIRERTPLVAMLGADGETRVLDRDGRVLDLIEGQPVALVWISGPGTLDTGLGGTAPIGYSSAASFVTKLTPTIRSRVHSMTVTPDGSDLRLILTGVDANGPIEVRFGSAIGDSDQIEKLVRLERKLEDVGSDPVSVIDVSTSEVTVL
jgi:cell division protein FtsQ